MSAAQNSFPTLPSAGFPYGTSPGPNKHLATDGAGVVDWYSFVVTGPGLDYILDPTIPSSLAPVYKTVAELEAAVSAGPPGSRVWFPNGSTTLSVGALSLPIGTMFCASGSPATGVCEVVIPPATTLDNFLGAGQGCVVTFQNAAPCLTFSGSGSNPWVLLTKDGGAIRRTGTAPLAQIPATQYGMWAPQGSVHGAVPAPTSAVFEGLDPASVLIGWQQNVASASSSSGIQPGDFEGLGTIVLYNGIGASRLTASDFPGFVGSLVQQYSADPKNLITGPFPYGKLADQGGWEYRDDYVREQLAMLDDPLGGFPVWSSGGFISIGSANKSFSASSFGDHALWSATGSKSVLRRWTIETSSAAGYSYNVEVWHRPNGGAAAATGIVIAVGAADTRAQNIVNELVVGDGDSIAFVTDTHVSTVWVSGYADRTDVSI